MTVHSIPGNLTSGKYTPLAYLEANVVRNAVLYIARGLPGALGRQLRAWSWAGVSAGFGRDVAIASGVTLTRGTSFSIGEGTAIDTGTFISARGGMVKIGDRVSINRDVYLNADLGGSLVIGNEVLIGPKVIARTCNHRFADETVPIRAQGHECRDIEVGEGSWLGAGVILLPGAKVGANTVVGAGSVVGGELPSMVVAAGNPAKILRSRTPTSTQRLEEHRSVGEE